MFVQAVTKRVAYLCFGGNTGEAQQNNNPEVKDFFFHGDESCFGHFFHNAAKAEILRMGIFFSAAWACGIRFLITFANVIIQ